MMSAKDALEISRDNPHARWNGNEGGAAERIAQRIIVPQGRQSFTVRPGDTFFAIGSCFARNVEERLHLAGATVSSLEIDVKNLGNNNAREGGVFNKYTPVSILQELKWAAGIESYPQEALLPVAGGQVVDPYLSSKAEAGSMRDMMVRRTEIGHYFAKVFEADVVILTLGLVETWIDTITGLHLNEAPKPRILARSADRFRFHQLSFEEVEAALDEVRQILEAHGKPGQKRVLTVSPVPLGRTFTADDIVVANMTAKSILRTAATRLTDRSKGMDYFPSYEAVSLSDPNLSWQQDRRHVSDVVVGKIIQTFLVRYGVSDQRVGDIEDAIGALATDASFRKWTEESDGNEALLARLNLEVNRYKNMVLRLQKELRDAAIR